MKPVTDLTSLTEKDVFLMKLRGETINLGEVFYPRFMGEYISRLVDMGIIKRTGAELVPIITIEVRIMAVRTPNGPRDYVFAAGEPFLVEERWLTR